MGSAVPWEGAGRDDTRRGVRELQADARRLSQDRPGAVQTRYISDTNQTQGFENCKRMRVAFLKIDQVPYKPDTPQIQTRHRCSRTASGCAPPFSRSTRWRTNQTHPSAPPSVSPSRVWLASCAAGLLGKCGQG